MERKDLYETPMPPAAFEPEDSPALWLIDDWRDVDLPEGSTPSPDYERVARWQIDSDGAAQWAMAHASEAKAQIDELELQHAAWRERLNEVVAGRLRPLANRLAFFEERLIDYAARQRAADPKAKSLALPSGRVASRAATARLLVEDAEAFVKWADAAERFDLFRIEKKPELATMKSALDVVYVEGETTEGLAVEGEGEWRVLDPATGEPVPGLTVAPPTVTFTVTPA